VSSHYFLFVIDEAKLDRRFLDFFIRTPAFCEQVAAQGSTNYAAIRPSHVLGYEIPLPPLAEQRRVVARIEELAAQIAEARTLRQQAVDEAEALGASETNARFTGEGMLRWPTRRLDEIAEIRSGVTLGRRLIGPTVRLPYLRVANVQDGYLDLAEIKEVEVLETEAEKWKLQQNDILLTEGGDWDKLGRGTVWREEIPDCIHQNHIFSVRARSEAFVPEFVSRLISSPVGKSYFQGASKQTTNLASINQRQLKAFPVFQPSLSEQRRIVAELDALQAQVDALKRLQVESAAELDALLPAILDRAFKGEL
jgi:type I restriction enzyme S subunit